MTDPLKPVTERIDAEFEDSIERLKDLLRIPSISTDPAYRDQTRAAADWCAERLAEIGLDASVRPTLGHPMVIAHDPGPGPDAPHLLYYAHYDVQPPDPLELWDHDPFDPQIVDSPHGGRIIARGACDDKGQMMTVLEAFRHWRAVHGTLPIRVTVLLEGEEESGSPSLEPFLRENHAELAADVAVVTDTGMWNVETPAITYMLRGLVYADVTLRGPSHDLHSGMYGGAVVNPLNALARILGGLHDAAGVVQIPGFYDDVQELSAEERQRWRDLGFDERAFLASAGLEVGTGEQGRSTLERTWCRPTCDVNGMWGGYTGKGAKTVIASEAHAKISCRLVAHQDPDAVYAGLVRFLEERTPAGCTWTFAPHGRNPAIRVPTGSPFLEAAQEGLRRTFGKNAELIGCGGSIPVVGSFQSLLGFDSLLVGFGLDDDRVHSPNEKFELQCYKMGIRSQAAMLEAFAGVKTAV